MATKKYPHEQYLEDGKDLFTTKELPSELQTQIKVWNMHKNKRDEKENGIKSLNIANELEVWMKEKGFLDEVQDDEPQGTPPTKTEAQIAEEVEAKLRAEATQKAADEAAAAQKAADDAAAAQKAADEAAAAQKAADDAAAAQKAADDAAAAQKAADEAAEAKKKADPHYGMRFYPIIGWVKE